MNDLQIGTSCIAWPTREINWTLWRRSVPDTFDLRYDLELFEPLNGSSWPFYTWSYRFQLAFYARDRPVPHHCQANQSCKRSQASMSDLHIIRLYGSLSGGGVAKGTRPYSWELCRLQRSPRSSDHQFRNLECVADPYVTKCTLYRSRLCINHSHRRLYVVPPNSNGKHRTYEHELRYTSSKTRKGQAVERRDDRGTLAAHLYTAVFSFYCLFLYRHTSCCRSKSCFLH